MDRFNKNQLFIWSLLDLRIRININEVKHNKKTEAVMDLKNNINKEPITFST